METTQTVLQSLRVGDWMVSPDLQDAYLQVPVHPSSRRYLRFCVGVSVYQFCALCFGLLTAPQAFIHVMAPVSSIMHRHGFRILQYLDNWLVLASTFREIVWARDFLLWLCRQLGIHVNLPKSSLDPSQTQDYLGMTITTSPLRVFQALKRIQKLSALLQDFLSDRLHPVSVWRQLLGVMSSMSALVPGARLRMMSLQLRLNVAGSLLLEDDLVSWTDCCLPDLRWWSDVSHLQAGLPLGEDRPDLFLFSDASDTCWEASLGDDHLSGSWSPLCSQFSINHRELLAVLYAIRSFFSFALGSSGGGLFRQHHGPGIPQEAGWHSLFDSECSSTVDSPPLRVPPHSSPSPVHSGSIECPGGFSKPEAFQELLRRWPATIDLFATSLNQCLPVYFSPMVDLQSAGTDAMLQPWDGLQAYAFPPFSLISWVLAKVRQSRGLELTLVARFWPHPWFPDLLELLVEVPLSLPRRRDLLKQPLFHHYHQNLPVLQLTAFRISSDPLVILDSLRRWLISLPTAVADLQG